jgi:hypothetical protein
LTYRTGTLFIAGWYLQRRALWMTMASKLEFKSADRRVDDAARLVDEDVNESIMRRPR